MCRSRDSPRKSRTELRELQAETDQLIGEEDLRRDQREDARRNDRGSSRASSRSDWGSEAFGNEHGAGNSGSEEEVARLQSLLQARDVQLQILMKMLAEADSTSVSHAQQIALLNQKLSSTLGGGTSDVAGAEGSAGQTQAAPADGGAVTATVNSLALRPEALAAPSGS